LGAASDPVTVTILVQPRFTAPGVYDDGDVPADGEASFYLVRGHDAGCGGAGSLGTDSTGAPRPPACP